MYLFTLPFAASSLLLATSTYAQQAPAAAPPAAAVTINPGPVAAGNAGNQGAAATTTAPGAANTGAGVIGSGSGIPVWVIKVGDPNNKLVFSPNSVTAKVGDMIQFQFYSKNHSVASSTFEQPCVPAAQANQAVAQNAFFSGFMPTEAQGQLTYTIPVRSTEPMWFYCSQGMHCQGGMVGVINPPASGQTLADYTARAAQAPQNISPGGGIAAQPGQASPAQPGQIGGTTAPAPAPATTARNSASSMGVWKQGTWSLGVVAFVAAVML